MPAAAGRDDITAEEAEKLVVPVISAADRARPLLERIPTTFKQHAKHNNIIAAIS